MAPWFYWIVGALVLTLLEVLLSGLVLMCFAFAAFMTAIVSIFGVSFEIQIITFIVSTVIAFVTIRPFFLKHMKTKEGHVETNIFALVGQEGMVVEEINPSTNAGRVKLRGEVWPAMVEGSEVVPVGTQVKVASISGNRVVIELLN